MNLLALQLKCDLSFNFSTCLSSIIVCLGCEYQYYLDFAFMSNHDTSTYLFLSTLPFLVISNSSGVLSGGGGGGGFLVASGSFC